MQEMSIWKNMNLITKNPVEIKSEQKAHFDIY